MSGYVLHMGDCLDPVTGLASLANGSVDAMVTDPPAGIGFMGKEWDSDRGGKAHWIAWLSSAMREALRVLKPGAHALVWALPRTSHWTATGIEDSGFELRDVVTHHFGTGFPKSLDVSKAIDGAAPATDAAKQWEGWGTALKPATEHWLLARKPLDGTVAANVQEHGTGALNIDACRIESGPRPLIEPAGRRDGMIYAGSSFAGSRAIGDTTQGRWPANVVLSHAFGCWVVGPDDYLCPVCGEVRKEEDCSRCGTRKGECRPECPIRQLDEQSGITRSSAAPRHNSAEAHNKTSSMGKTARGWTSGGHEDAGGASRFFYCAKPSTAEKERGLAHLPKKTGVELIDREEGSAGIQNPRAGAGRVSSGRANVHPTVKSVALMEWLVRLITPPRGIVLDPFAGSGTTAIAAVGLGFGFVGWERDADYHAVAEARIRAAKRQLELCA